MYATTVVGIMYSFYALLVLTLMGLFAYGVTYHKKRISLGFEISIVTWVTFLIILAVAFHVITYMKLPWIKWELLSKEIEPKKEVIINVMDYKFQLPENPITIELNKPVKFKVYSQDVTYGFGVFRSDGTLLFQMQVLPGHANEIIWFFHEEGKYTIRSTEYSGPQNWKMVLKDAIIVKR